MGVKVTAGGRLTLHETGRQAEILRNVALILGTVQGTVPLYRDFGIPPDALDLPLPAAKARMRVQVKEAVERYETRVEVLGVSFLDVRGAEGKLLPVVEVNILAES